MIIDDDYIVCNCLGVTYNDIVEAILEKGLTTADEVGEETEAGTMCGSCVPDIEDILLEIKQAKEEE